MAQFHFVEDYEALVAQLMKAHPLDEAMSLAVGGNYEEFGQVERALLEHAGLRDGMTLVDLGCGSGRLAHALGQYARLEYIGIDIIAELLKYARTKCPRNYRFILHRELSIPLPTHSVDMVCAFSLFTHLLHEETYIYLEEVMRVLKPGGKLVFSFLEFESGTAYHWKIFQDTVTARRHQARPHLNTFIERNAIEVWARHLGGEVLGFVAGDEVVPNATACLGQTVAILGTPP
jgi:ubiquinone/menaquinone biosynthesis C-methylase UbiE